MRYHVFIQGLEVLAHIGVPEEERASQQTIRVDLDCTMDGNAPETDEIADTLDYSLLCDVIESVARDNRCATLERLARLIDLQIGAKFAIVEGDLSLSKCPPPVRQVAQSAGVRIELGQGSSSNTGSRR